MLFLFFIALDSFLSTKIELLVCSFVCPFGCLFVDGACSFCFGNAWLGLCALTLYCFLTALGCRSVC